MEARSPGGRPERRRSTLAPGPLKEDIVSFFQNCTSQNIRWRQNVRRKLEQAADSVEFINLSKLALAYGHGTPAKMVPEGQKRESLIFLGLKPWEIRGELDVITDKIIAEKAAEEKLKAIEAKAEPVAADKTDRDSEVPESLELVEPSPDDYPGGRR